MDISMILEPQGVYEALHSNSRKHLLQEMATRAAEITGIDEQEIFERLLQREKLGTTGVGKGVAIPHARFDSLKRIYGFFARLETPVDFQSVDDQPVDLVFMLLAPENTGADHLKALACVSRFFRDEAMCARLRGTEDAEALFAMMVQPLELAA